MEQSTSAEVAKSTPSKVKPVDPIFLNTPTGAVAVFGHEYVSRKMLEVLNIALSYDAFEITYHGVKNVVFRIDGYPKENGSSICANFAPDTGGVAINLVKTLERAIERSMDHPSTSLMASWWIEMLLNFGHEIHHAVRWDTDRTELTESKEKRNKEEDLAEKYSNEMIIALAQGYDIEPPVIAQEVWFNGQIAELLNGKEDDKWAESQKEMLDNQHLWEYAPSDSTKETVVLSTFKDLMCLITNGDETSDIWNKETFPIPEGIKTLDEQLNGRKIVINKGPSTKATTHIPPDVGEQPCEDFYADDEFENSPAAVQTQPAQFQPVQPQPAKPAQSMFVDPNQNTGVQYSATDVSRIAQQVYMKIYHFIFTNCGQLLESDLGFSNPEVVCLTPIPLTDEERNIFVSMNHQDTNGRWCTDVPTTGGLLGKVMKNTKLPAYELTLNVNGAAHKRLVIPQNTAKRNATGQLTQRASEARAGGSITYVIIPSDGKQTQYGPSIINGQYKLPYPA